MPPPVTWVVTDGKAGMESQCLGLAEALGVAPTVKRISPRLPWRLLPPPLWLAPLAAPGGDGDRLASPWPDLLIATGRQTVAPAAAIRRAARGATFAVQIQDPGVPPDRFDLVVAPAHDGLAGPNVIATLGALHRVTRARLDAAAARLAPAVAHLPHPRVAVLVGGPNRHYRMDAAAVERLAADLARLARTAGAGLLVTPSRRTGAAAEATLRRVLEPVPSLVWDGSGENPYFGFLGLADAVVVTADSVNMACEAAATGKPVHVVALDGGSAKFDRFHAALRERGIARPFDGTLAAWTYPPLDETARVAAAIRARATGLNFPDPEPTTETGA
ncbi:MAG: mitochondrial fission ELM1 family protein [Rhodospirillales bacterium]